MTHPSVHASVRSDWRLLMRAFATLKPYRRDVALLVLVLCGGAISGALPFYMLKDILDSAVRTKDMSRLFIDCALLAFFPLIGHLLGVAQVALNTRLGQAILRDMRNQLFQHLQRLPLAFYTRTKAGEIHARFTNDIAGLQSFLTNTASEFISSALAMLTTVALMLYISPVLTLILLLVLPAFLFNHVWSSNRRRPLFVQRQQVAAKISGFLAETLSINGVLLTKVFGRQKLLTQRFAEQNDELSEIEVRQQLIGSWGFMGFSGLMAFVPAALALVGGWQVITGHTLLGMQMTVGSLVAFFAVQGRFFGPAVQMSTIQSSIQGALPLFERIDAFLKIPAIITEAKSPVVLHANRVRGEVAFRNVSFSYEGREAVPGQPKEGRIVLRDVNFTIPAGKMVALVGRSGAGKTTIGYLLPRLYDVDTGAVTIDGYDVRSLSSACLSELVSVVTQEPFLLHASVRDNLLFARADATETELIAAARAAAIHSRILELELGYDTIVGERGYGLSGGEKQRLAIARAILRNAPVLVLDEATSALDTHSERLVQKSLNALVHGRTTLVIAHRLSTVLTADTILVIEDGKIVERGTHAELLDGGGKYAHLYRNEVGDKPSPVSVA